MSYGASHIITHRIAYHQITHHITHHMTYHTHITHHISVYHTLSMVGTVMTGNDRTANYFTPSLHHASVTISPRFHHDSAFCMEILRHDYHDRTTLELRVYYALHARTTRHALTTIFLNMFKTSPRAPRSSRPTTLERDVTTTPLRRDALSLRRDAISPRSHHD